jgi:preprotein translocase subunit SecF
MQFMGSKKKWWFIISGIVILPGILSLIFWGLRWGIDFKGGSLYEVRIKKESVRIEEVKETLKPLNLPDLSVVATAQSTFLIKTAPIEQEQINQIKDKIKEKFGETEEIRYETVGPVVGTDLRKKAIWAVSLACFFIVLYIAWAFRSVPKPQSSFKFGLCAIIALVHDILVVLGTFSILGHFLGYEVDAYFITALLTVLGFSVHDTIVVFDRIRENLKRLPGIDFETVANESVIQTLTRSINTSLTVILVLLALFLLGGETIKPFVLALLIGMTTGTYSSIFNATPLLVIWQRRAK